jgi:hypothetical protein
MARTIAEIQDQIITSIQADTDLSGVNSPSRRALWRLWTYIVAVAISVFEQILDIAKVDFETIVRAAPPATAEWIRGKMLEFQYDPDTAQHVQLVDFVPQYLTVDESLRIITRCGVNVSAYNTVYVKVAKGTQPGPLSESERLAAQDYLRIIGIAGIHYLVVSLPPDRLFIHADIYIKGSNQAYVMLDVPKAIEGYLTSIPFDGVMKIVDLIDTMKSVPGVSDVVLHSIAARTESVSFANRTSLIKDKTLLNSKWQTQAGYMVPEDTTGQTLSETLNYIVQ